MDDSSIKRAIIKTFFYLILMKHGVLQLQHISSKSDQKQKSFIGSPSNGCIIS